MRIGIGLPNTIHGTEGRLLMDWARRAEERGFAFVPTVGRVGYPLVRLAHDARRGRRRHLDDRAHHERGDFPGERRPMGPAAGEVPVLIGGHSERAVRRTVRWGAGWTGAGGGPRRAEPTVAAVRDAWEKAGREGEPRLPGLAHFGTDDSRAEQSDAYVRGYYADAGDHADTSAEGAVRTPERIRGVVREFTDIGVNELTFTPTLARLDEVDRLADLVL